ncbi:UspA domain-containing protein [Halovivax asiaticus JCM 14624]|uniref:UspA domain-containing protein n=1 Tax=Halovivax asiaticus JCM 14624 TaxID=1227490 RepID=M0BNY4_9EURY|nr:universal stress protein [Halovivax asiaticus]ELZ11998.1 UspA domain-containing protein [Halovivax asiaticus JCM 14624]
MFERVLVATDGSESVRRAIDVGLDVAERFDADLHAVTVLDTGELASTPEALREEYRAALESQAETALDSFEQQVATESVSTAIRDGRPEAEIRAHADEIDADLIVAGTRGRHGEHRQLLGSVAEHLVRTSSVPVLTVRQLATDEEAER